MKPAMMIDEQLEREIQVEGFMRRVQEARIKVEEEGWDMANTTQVAS
jgi:hypothetical protein